MSRFESNSLFNGFNTGVSNEKGDLKLFMHEESEKDPVKWSTGSSFLEEKINVNSKDYVSIEVIRLSDFISKIDKKIRVLKMDIEGMEYKVLKDLIESDVVKKIDHILVETHEDKIPSLKKEAQEVRNIIRDKKISNIDLNWI